MLLNQLISMLKKAKNIIHILQNLYLKEKVFLKKKSYSQDNSDLKIIEYFDKKNNGFFVDIGCFHPTRMNNTYLLYRNGWSGINIDLSEFSIDLFNFYRPKDINIRCAISDTPSKKTLYYQKKFSLISTLDKKLAEKRFQGPIKQTEINSDNINNVIRKTKFNNTRIDFLNIDAEGMDELILKSLDFKTYKPRLICAEDSVYNRKFYDTNLYKILKPYGYNHLWSSVANHIFYVD